MYLRSPARIANVVGSHSLLSSIQSFSNLGKLILISLQRNRREGGKEGGREEGGRIIRGRQL